MSEEKPIATPPLSRFLTEAIGPMLRRPPQLQVAALCTRTGAEGTEVLLVTSRGTGRWILPKGWPMTGKTLAEAAVIEAWEEAGVKGVVETVPLGDYEAQKDTDSGLSVPCRVAVYRLHVDTLANAFPEAEARNRRWFRPADAAKLVRETDLQRLLSKL
jgi:8-oxo-dGTP pyrophosphatase MutT (NUDIX family)